MSQEITIRLSGADGYVSVDALIETLENTVEILRGVAHQYAPGTVIRWEVVRAQMRSPFELTLAPKVLEPKAKKTADRVVREFYKGWKKIAAAPASPDYFGEEALEATKKLVTDIAKEHTSLSISIPNKEPVAATPAIAEHVDEVVRQSHPTRHEWGTIEGVLEQVSTRGRDTITVWESVTGFRVDCLVSRELLEEAKRFLPARVAVSGKIRYKGGRPVSIQADRLKRLRDRSELPQPETMGPINITGGASSEDFVRGWRDGNLA